MTRVEATANARRHLRGHDILRSLVLTEHGWVAYIYSSYSGLTRRIEIA